MSRKRPLEHAGRWSEAGACVVNSVRSQPKASCPGEVVSAGCQHAGHWNSEQLSVRLPVSFLVNAPSIHRWERIQ